MFTPNLQEPESGIEKETLLFKYKFPLPSDISQHIPTDSKYAVGFNPSINSETQHVIWEMAISLNELTPPETSGGGNGVLANTIFGIMLHSTTPSITLYYPPDFYGSSGFMFDKALNIVIIPPPPVFQVSNLNINPSTVTTGEEVTISVTASNSGGSSGTYNIALKVNGNAEDSKQVTLNPGESTTVTFKYTPSQEGTYTIDVNELTGNLVVNPPPAGGLPIGMIAAGGIGAAAVIGAILFLKMRKPKEKVPEPTVIRLTSDKNELYGDGKSTTTIKIELLDEEGKAVPTPNDLEVNLTTNMGHLPKTVVIPAGESRGTVTLMSSTDTGNVKVMATAKNLKNGLLNLTFIEKKRYCMHCGARMPPDAERCPVCGKMPPSGKDVKKCPNCGAIIPATAKFCSECGAKQT